MMTFTSQDMSGLGDIRRMNTRGKGFPVLRFWFLAVNFEGVEHQCAPTLGQPETLHLLTMEMC